MTEPSKDHDPKKIPHVRAGGKDWPVPRLAARQLREVRVPLMEMTNRANTRKDGDGKVNVGDVIVELSKEEYDRFVLEVVFQGLTRAHPTLTFEEFLDLEFDDGDMTMAWLTVRRQSGLFVFKAGTPDEKDGDAAGEATGESQPPQPTGTGTD